MDVRSTAIFRTLAVFGLEKQAISRWKKEFQAGRMSPEEQARMLPPEQQANLQLLNKPVGNRPPTESFSNKLRAILGQPAVPDPESRQTAAKTIAEHFHRPVTDLSMEQLNQHQLMRGLQSKALGKAEGAHAMNLPGLGPATLPLFGRGHVFTGPQSGTGLRLLAEGDMEKGLPMLQAPTMKPEQYMRHGKPEDPTIHNAILQHELAEKNMYQAGRAGKYQVAPVASHLGTQADVAERLPSFRDPRAQEAFNSLRSGAMGGTGDSALAKKMRQFGATTEAPMPLGGKTHRALENYSAMKMPLGTETLVKRLQTRGPVSEENLKKLTPIMQSLRDVSIPSFIPQQYHARAQDLQRRGVDWLHNYLRSKATAPMKVDPRQFMAHMSTVHR